MPIAAAAAAAAAAETSAAAAATTRATPAKIPAVVAVHTPPGILIWLSNSFILGIFTRVRKASEAQGGKSVAAGMFPND
jgi:hypothetical protein